MAHTHAVVIGGSIAGLTVAKALAGHFAAVTVLERDLLPDGPGPRKGLPHAWFLHNLLPGGDEALETLFPGFRETHLANGAVEFGGEELCWLTPEGWLPRFPMRRRTTASSRDLVDWSIRQMVASDARITIRDGTGATGLIVSDNSQAVLGVRLHSIGADPDDEEILPADFVVDASGRGSRAHRWIQCLGYDAPREYRIDSQLVYASRIYRPPSGVEVDWKLLIVSPRPDSPRYGAIFSIEGGRWMAALGGVGGVLPPKDDTGYLDFAASLPTPAVYEALRQADPLTPVRRYRRTENLRRRWEAMPRHLERFIVVGDAACAFNPEFGQGMSVAARTAVAIKRGVGEHLRRHPDGDLTGLAGRLQRLVTRIAAPAWDMATGEDLKFPTTVGGKVTPTLRLAQWYGNRVLRAATRYPDITEAFLAVVSLVDPPTTLLRPAVVRRALLVGAARPGDPAQLPRPQSVPLGTVA
jgi:flavin-dependent dehydrogenase